MANCGQETTVTKCTFARESSMEPESRPPPASVDEPPTEEELTIIRMLAKGLTDEVVAQRVGISKRTYRRRLKAAMRKLGASSRFEAGAAAVRKGWLCEEHPPQ